MRAKELALVALSTLSAAQISTCPVAETTLLTDDGSFWQTCPNSDYQGPSSNIVPNIANVSACLQVCSRTQGCVKSVYDHNYQYCHVKSTDPLTWVTSAQYDASRFITKTTIGSQISSCPVPETTQTINGKSYALCSYSDYQGQTVQITPNIADRTACAKLCASNSNCAKAVYDHIYNYCHFKTSTGSLTWTVSKQFDTLRLITMPNNTPMTSCPVQETNTTVSGKTYALCPNSDYQGPSVQITPNVADITACETLCANNVNCAKAVYDHINSVCHFKTTTGSLAWVTSHQFDSVRLIPSTIGPISSCPVQETNKTVNGKTYALCPNSDYQGPSVKITQNVADITACESLCANDANCAKAVYDHINSVCHFKTTTGPLNWVSSQQFSSMRLIPNVSGPLSSCPVATISNIIGARTYVICPGSDYQGTSKEVIKNIPNNIECAKLCTATTCSKAVFDHVNKVCHLKSDSDPLTWVASQQFDTMVVTSTTDPSKFGKWSNIITLSVIPVAAYIVPAYPESSRILAFSSYASNDFGGAGGVTQFTDYNFKTGAVSARTVSNTGHDMFCPGISSLADGRLVISGGSDANKVSIYSPDTNSFSAAGAMIMPRGYQASTTLSNGKVFTIGGSYSGGITVKNGETYDPASNQWTMLPNALVAPMLTTDAAGAWREDNHGWLVGWKDGSVFQAGPSKAMNWYTTSGSGGVTSAGTRDNNDAMCGVWAMYDAVNGKIFSAAGSQDYTNSPALFRAHTITIGDVNTQATVHQLPDLTYARGFGNAVTLPDGTVLITGGQHTSEVFTDFASILAPELFNPKTNTFTVLTPAAVPRNYHSVSLLLPDGTVFTGGGGMCYSPKGQSDANCNRAADHMNAEIFTPPYLFKTDGTPATRPVINSLSSSVASNGYTARLGGTLTVTLDTTSRDTTFSLMRIGSATHSVNTDQRRVPLTNTKQHGSTWTLTIPGDAGVVIPGTYYLFAISNSGVPSMAKTVKVTA